jgi:hypothetical protein
VTDHLRYDLRQSLVILFYSLEPFVMDHRKRTNARLSFTQGLAHQMCHHGFKQTAYCDIDPLNAKYLSTIMLSPKEWCRMYL